jgi:hypothetical protein
MRHIALVAAALVSLAPAARSQTTPPGVTPGAPKGTMLLTVVFRHDQSKPLPDINAELKRNGFYDRFPPAGVKVVSWYVMMGLGQVVTLRFPAERLRDVNAAIEQTAWGGYRTEFYPTYDYRELAQEAKRKAASGAP